MTNELQFWMQQAFRKMGFNEEIDCYFGIQVGPDEWELEENPDQPGFFTVTRQDGTGTHSARNRTTTLKPGLAVKVKLDKEGQYEIVGVGGKKGDTQLQNSYPGMVGYHPHDIGSGLEYIHPLRLFEPGLVHVYNSGVNMTVYCEPFWYPLNGDRVYFAGGTLDLASNVPSAGLARIALISVAHATNTLQATNGATTAVANFGTLGQTDVDAINVYEAVPLTGIRLRAGQTQANREIDFFDARALVQSVSVTDGIGFPIVITTAITIPTNRQIVLGRLEYGTGGSVTYEGTGTIYYA